MRVNKSGYLVFASFVGLVGVAACSTDATAPTLVADPAISASSVVAAAAEITVSAMLRTKPLARDVIVSAVIGSKGGKIKIDETGFELKVPRGAVTSATKFQVKALAGVIIAYEFEPHGATFRVPLTFRQELKVMKAKDGSGRTPEIGYFSGQNQLNQATGTASVQELQPAIVVTDFKGNRIEGNIYHFSGYLVSSGRAMTVTR